jgi:CRP-like cAMP-binding protein
VADPLRNRMIASLPTSVQGELVAIVEPVELPHRAVLFEPDQPVSTVLFPTSGVVSLLTVMSDGESIEAGLVGREGMFGRVVTDGSGAMPWRAIVQMPGEALRAQTRDLARHPALYEALRRLESRYLRALHWLATLSIACNRFHRLDERCARWLLMMHDRAEGDDLWLTHEFLSEMLGARRQSVTRALMALQRAKLITRTRRSHIVVTDRAGLERATCECYARMQRFLPLDASADPERIALTDSLATP